MQAGEIIGLILLLLSCVFIIHFISAFILYMINLPFFFTPKDIYKKTEMNWFGCIVIYILLFPIAFVYEIGGFLKWLFTVGRK